MLYTDDDFARADIAVRREAVLLFAFTLPFFACAVIALCLRSQIFCCIFTILLSFSAIFLLDTRLIPVLRYRSWIREAQSGLSHETAGVLMSIGSEDVWENGMRLRELILNIYSDLAEEGERRFLLDAAKKVPEEFLGRVVVVKSHDTSILGVKLREERTQKEEDAP